MEKLKPKKSLGQNFLKDAEVLKRIIEAANLSAEDVVIEIGSGEGALTEKLAAVCKKVIAVEIDKSLVEVLDSRFHGNDKIEIIHDDILKINLPELVAKKLRKLKANEASYKVVANIPYYITAPIIRLFLETEYPPKEMILMVQKEVAERICAQSGDMSILAVSVQYYAQPEYLFTVSKTAFEPVPKVDSTIIKISNLKSQISNQERNNFFRIVRMGFSAKRKTLANNLSNGLKIDKKEIEEKINSIVFSPPKADQPEAGKNIRAQELSVEDWKKLSETLIK